MSPCTPRCSRYRGRFAPSPTGPLHLGSLLAAVASYLRARHRGGEWLLRIDDLDPPREITGAADDMLRMLARFEMHWDGNVVYQSKRQGLYTDALERLARRGLTFPCACARADIGHGAYPGTCRAGLARGKQARSVRVRAPGRISFHDAIQGDYAQDLGQVVGDFVVHRADGLVAYHLATVVDDAAQGITEVVRGGDLLESTPRQIHLQRCLGLPTPAYAHVPVLVNPAGQKLSKQTGARALDPRKIEALLCRVLDLLGQRPPEEMADATLNEIWGWAIAHWDLARVPATGALCV